MLILYGNNLFGQLHDRWGNLTELNSILVNNAITGKIPDMVSNPRLMGGSTPYENQVWGNLTKTVVPTPIAYTATDDAGLPVQERFLTAIRLGLAAIED